MSRSKVNVKYLLNVWKNIQCTISWMLFHPQTSYLLPRYNLIRPNQSRSQFRVKCSQIWVKNTKLAISRMLFDTQTSYLFPRYNKVICQGHFSQNGEKKINNWPYMMLLHRKLYQVPGWNLSCNYWVTKKKFVTMFSSISLKKHFFFFLKNQGMLCFFYVIRTQAIILREVVRRPADKT